MTSFIGRAAELEKLMAIYNEVRDGYTKCVLIKADTGIGKTRLVQEFYHKLSIEYDEHHYWPDLLEDTKHTMTIVPQFPTLMEDSIKYLPWLWMAVRCKNSIERNSLGYNEIALSHARQQLRLHMGSLFEREMRKTTNINFLKSSITILSNYAFPGGGPILVELVGNVLENMDKGIGIFQAAKDIWKKIGNKVPVYKDRSQSIAKQEYTSLVDQTLEVLSVIFNKGDKRLPTTPVVFVLDDAQWADKLTLDFMKEVMNRGISEGWPLMILCTCWESSYKEQTSIQCGEKNFGSYTKELIKNPKKKSHVEIVDLNKLHHDSIKNIINNLLPNISEQAKDIMSKLCSGDLELLLDYIKRLKHTPGYLNKDGKLMVSEERIKFKTMKKKELARERIQELGIEFSFLIALGSAQGITFTKGFIDKCYTAFGESFLFSLDHFEKCDDPHNLTKVQVHSVQEKVAEFRRVLYFEIAREILDEMPQKEDILIVLVEYYSELILIWSKEEGRSEPDEMREIFEGFLSLCKEMNQQKTHEGSYKKASLHLAKIYLYEGLFDRCIELGEALMQRSELTENEYKELLNVLIEATFSNGNITLEEKYIREFEEYYYHLDKLEPMVSIAKARFDMRHRPEKALTSVTNALNLYGEDKADQVCFELELVKVRALFYAGDNENGFLQLNNIEERFKELINQDLSLKVLLSHNIGLLCHNVDLNRQVIQACGECKEGYKLSNDTYQSLISSVNLSDGYLGAGQMEKALAEGKEVYELSKDYFWDNLKYIAAINYANVLSKNGQYQEASILYEEGLATLESLNHYWHLYYGKSWYMLNRAEMGDGNAWDELLEIRRRCKEHGFTYLIALSTCFALLVANILKLDSGENHPVFTELLESMDGTTPGLYSQSIAAYCLLHPKMIQEKEDLLVKLISFTLSCEGMKGKPDIIFQLFQQQAIMDKIPHDKLQEMNEWFSEYISKKSS